MVVFLFAAGRVVNGTGTEQTAAGEGLTCVALLRTPVANFDPDQRGRASLQRIGVDADPVKEITKITLEAAQAIELDTGVVLLPGSYPGARMRTRDDLPGGVIWTPHPVLPVSQGHDSSFNSRGELLCTRANQTKKPRRLRRGLVGVRITTQGKSFGAIENRNPAGGAPARASSWTPVAPSQVPHANLQVTPIAVSAHSGRWFPGRLKQGHRLRSRLRHSGGHFRYYLATER